MLSELKSECLNLFVFLPQGVLHAPNSFCHLEVVVCQNKLIHVDNGVRKGTIL